jgi:hypothetical protein
MRNALQAWLGVLVVLAIVGVYVGTQRRPRPERAIDATSAFADDWRGHGPQRAFDGDPRTEWHAEDMTAGTIVRRFDPAIQLTNITLLNAQNPPWNDRATDRYRIELVDASGAVRTIPGRARPGERIEHRVDATDLRELRFVAETFHGSSPGVAELVLDPPPP